MFNSHALPPPSPFAHEHRPLRLTSEPPHPIPVGECRSILLHPSVTNQQCSCQHFHHNRNAPGSTCDCGHNACFHVHTTSSLQDSHIPRDSFQISTIQNLVDRVRRLEDALNNERQIWDAALREERQERERVVRILREALHPVYKGQEEMQRKHVELEDRVEGNYDEQVRWRDRLVAIDDANMDLEKRVEDLEGSRTKRRRISQHPDQDGPLLNGHHSSKQGSNPSSCDDKLLPKAPSLQNSPPISLTYEAEPEEPRSSGILNLVDMNKSQQFIPSRRPSPPREEARSSGFLALDLAERFAHKSATCSPPNTLVAPIPISSFSSHVRHLSGQDRRAPLSIVSVLDDTHVLSQSKRHTSVEIFEVNPEGGSPKKRKRHGETMALDVLANVSVASPLA